MQSKHKNIFPAANRAALRLATRFAILMFGKPLALPPRQLHSAVNNLKTSKREGNDHGNLKERNGKNE